MPTYLSSGLQLNYDEYGQGAPLVLQHGFGQNAASWRFQAERLARHFKVIVPDMRGCGKSQAAEPGFGIADYAGDIVALLDHLELEKVHFSGWSLGGVIGLELGIRHGERLKTLALHSSLAGGRGNYQRNWTEMRRRVMLSGDRELDFQTRIIGFFSPEFIDLHPERIEEFRQMELSNPYRNSDVGLAGQVTAARAHDAREQLCTIHVPTLITVGSADRTTPPAAARQMHSSIAGAELVIFDNAGHFPPFQCVDEFVTLSLGFVLKHDE